MLKKGQTKENNLMNKNMVSEIYEYGTLFSLFKEYSGKYGKIV